MILNDSKYVLVDLTYLHRSFDIFLHMAGTQQTYLTISEEQISRLIRACACCLRQLLLAYTIFVFKMKRIQDIEMISNKLPLMVLKFLFSV